MTDTTMYFSELEARTKATELHDQVLRNAIIIMCNIEPTRKPTLAPDTVDAILTATVSYTHLTLPTIYSV